MLCHARVRCLRNCFVWKKFFCCITNSRCTVSVVRRQKGRDLRKWFICISWFYVRSSEPTQPMHVQLWQKTVGEYNLTAARPAGWRWPNFLMEKERKKAITCKSELLEPTFFFVTAQKKKRKMKIRFVSRILIQTFTVNVRTSQFFSGKTKDRVHLLDLRDSGNGWCYSYFCKSCSATTTFKIRASC